MVGDLNPAGCPPSFLAIWDHWLGSAHGQSHWLGSLFGCHCRWGCQMDYTASQVFLVRVPGQAGLEAIFSPRQGFRFTSQPGWDYLTGSRASRTQWLGTRIRQKCSMTSLARQGQHLSSADGQSCCVCALSLGNSASGLLGALVRFPGWMKLRCILSSGRIMNPLTYLDRVAEQSPRLAHLTGQETKLCRPVH